MAEQNLSQRKLARMCAAERYPDADGWKRYIARYLKGTIPEPAQAAVLAEVLNVPVVEFLQAEMTQAEANALFEEARRAAEAESAARAETLEQATERLEQTTDKRQPPEIPKPDSRTKRGQQC